MAKPLIEIERELAKQRQGTRTDLTEGNIEQNFARSLEVFAKKVGSNKETVRQALYLIEYAPPEELEKLRKGETLPENSGKGGMFI
jgi:hypothetical protein